MAFGVLARGSGVFSLVVGFNLLLLLSGVFEVLILGKSLVSGLFTRVEVFAFQSWIGFWEEHG